MLHTQNASKVKKTPEHDIIIKEEEKNPFPLDNEWCDGKKEKKNKENSKSYTSPTVAIILVMSLF
jgi:hypothetical protein